MRKASFILTLAIILGTLLVAFPTLPVGIARSLIPTASAHALPVRSDPASDAILQAPPSRVRMWFSEDLNPYTSRIVVVDPTNRQVDNKDSHVASDNSREMFVDLPLLPAGTYIVAWRTQSAADGHIVGGSYIFRIARPDGSLPPLPSVLPTGNIPGAGGSGAQASGTLDGPTTFQAITTWLALLFMTFWVGGLIWQTWVLPPTSGDGSRDPDLTTAPRAAAERFSRLAPIALMLILVADVGIVLGQSAALAGTWTGAFSPPLLRAVLFGSRFGTFWWIRQAVTMAALILTLATSWYGWALYRNVDPVRLPAPDATPPAGTLPDWRRETLSVFRDVRHLPARLVWGVRQRTLRGQLELLLGLALLLAFAFSGHAAAVPASTFAYAIAVDILHLLCEAAWVGGLLYIGVVFLPALQTLTSDQRARVLALGLPEFSAIAIVGALILATTGSLSTTIHLTSITQFLTTSYGRTLAIKIELFLVMVAISAYHAFFLRPRLAQALTAKQGTIEATQPERQTVHAPVAQAEAIASRRSAPAGAASPPTEQLAASGTQNGNSAASPHALDLADRLASWLRREAVLGVAVLACVALLGAFAGSLTPATSGAPAAPSSSGAIIQTQQVNGYAVTLKVTPAQFGTNTFTVTVKDASGQPVKNVSVLIETVMLDMDMGTQAVQL
ncbi:MAG: copper resistance protein CopC, partial [Ktedonobacterales bacterium]